MLPLGCGCCETCVCKTGELPYTMTVKFADLVNKTHSRHCHLTIAAPFGSGADAVAMLPGGCDDKESVTCGSSNRGPLTSVLLVKGGSGYAIYGRSPPTLAISGGGGTGATFTPTLTKDTSGSCPVWSLSAVSVSGGTGYTDGKFLTITTAADDITLTAATAKVRTTAGRIEPTITVLAGDPGEGATLTAILAKTGSPPTWHVDSVTVVSGGSGFLDYELTDAPSKVTFSSPDTVVTSAAGNVLTHISQPLTFQMYDLGVGVGATITPSLSQITVNGRKAWEMVDATIASTGSGYVVGDQIEVGWPEFYAHPEQSGVTYPGVVDVISVDNNGGVSEVSVSQAGVYRVYDDSIESIQVTEAGSYYAFGDDGIPVSVEVMESGKYYREDSSQTPCAAAVTVTPCGGGSDAKISATVGTDPSNPATWTKITALTIDKQQGDNYLAWHWACTNHATLNGKDFVLRANSPKRLVTLRTEACFGGGANLVVDNAGPRVEPLLSLSGPCSGDANTPCGGTVTHTLTKHAGDDGQSYWSINSVTASGGQNHPDTSTALVTAVCPVTTLEPANITLTASGGAMTGATINNGGKYYARREWDGTPSPLYSISVADGGSGYAVLGREQPSISIFTTGNGSGATFTPTFKQRSDACGLPYWEITKVAVSGSGSKYGDGDALTVPVSGFVCQKQADMRVWTHEQPTITAAVAGSTGSGASLSLTLEKNTSLPHTWKVASLTGGGGSGYKADAHVVFSFGDATEVFAAQGGVNLGDAGNVISVTLLSGGEYYLDLGRPQEVTVNSGGRYWRENAALPPHVADIIVEIEQSGGSSGSGATVTPVVDTKASSPTFGRIISASVSGGGGYSPFGGPTDCLYVGGCRGACNVAMPYVSLSLPGKGMPVDVALADQQGGYDIEYRFRSSDVVNDCDSLPTKADLLYGAPSGSVTITRGGTWDSRGTAGCGAPCVCPSVEDLCITFTITDYNGTVHVPTISYGGNSAYVSVTILNELGFLAMYYNAIVQCQDGKLVLGGSGAVYVNSKCPTGATGDALCLGCDCECPENWWLADETFELHYDCTELDCSECDHVDDVLGTIRIEISNPPC